MATYFQNIANLSYNYGDGNTRTVQSNTVTGQIMDSLSMQKMVINPNYCLYENLTYVITIKNSGDTAYNNLVVTDNLGSYTLENTTVTPLDFIPNTSYISINSADLTPISTSNVSDNSISFTIPTLASGDTAKIFFTSRTNDFAPLTAGSTIVNISSLSQGNNVDSLENITASATATASECPRVEITKYMSPDTLVAGGPVSYTFTVSNYGNVEATNLQITDRFQDGAVPTQIDSVTINSVPYTDYTYVDGLLTIGSNQSLELPPATFSQDPSTGIITSIPSVMSVVVNGTF